MNFFLTVTKVEFLFKWIFQFRSILEPVGKENLILKEKISLTFKENVDITSQKERIMLKIESLKKQIDNLNKTVLPKSELNNKFSEFNTLK